MASEDPTQRIAPRTPVPPVRERQVAVPAGPDPLMLDEALRTLRTLLALTALLAAIALGVAVYAAIKANDDNGGGNTTGASRARVSALSDRVDRLENRVGSTNVSDLETRLGARATKGELDQVRQDVAALQKSAAQPSSAGDTQRLDALAQRVDDLSQKVDDLQSQSQSTTP